MTETGVVEVACPVCGQPCGYLPRERSDHVAPCADCSARPPDPDTPAGRAAAQRREANRQAIAATRAALHGAPAPAPSDEFEEFE